jgi:hypothetical protein
MKMRGCSGEPDVSVKSIDTYCGKASYYYTATVKRRFTDTDANRDAWKAKLAERIFEKLQGRTMQNIPLTTVQQWINLRESKWTLLTAINGCDAFMVWITKKWEEALATNT